MELQLFLIITTIVLLFLFKDGVKILFDSICDGLDWLIDLIRLLLPFIIVFLFMIMICMCNDAVKN